MAIFHYTVKIVGRSKGKSIISASAYLNGDVMKNEETGRISYYTSKREVVYTNLLMCENAPQEWLNVPAENIRRFQKSCEKDDWCNMIITITDNGIGMSEDFQKHIFEIFERERNSTVSHIEGSGIGMGITKKLVDLMDGTIEVKSKQGEGSIFTVTVPCRKASKEDSMMKKKSNLRNKNCLNGVRILLVEDNEINAEIATELLTEEGCIVETANDGVACIDMIEKADADYYKMILMDIQMPVMNGYDAALAIRKMKDTKKSRIPIIAMTANVFAEDIQKVLSVGMNAHVTKPVDMNILVPTMMKYL